MHCIAPTLVPFDKLIQISFREATALIKRHLYVGTNGRTLPSNYRTVTLHLTTRCNTCSATSRSPASDYGLATANCTDTCEFHPARLGSVGQKCAG